jgi:pentatricopeptide repeat protein
VVIKASVERDTAIGKPHKQEFLSFPAQMIFIKGSALIIVETTNQLTSKSFQIERIKLLKKGKGKSYAMSFNYLKVDSLFKEMNAEGIRPNVVTYTSMIDAFSKGENLEKAVEFFTLIMLNPTWLRSR